MKLRFWKNKKKRIYLDYAATTPVDKRIQKAMHIFERSSFGNPSSIHQEGRDARDAVSLARTKVARALRVRTEEIIFTSGGTEANNLAIRGAIEYARKSGRVYSDMHIITSAVEHTSVLECIRELESLDVRVTYLRVDGNGHISLDDLTNSLSEKTVLVSLMYVNNEIGTITSLRKISKAIKPFRTTISKNENSYPLLHTDACQAPLFLDCSPDRLGVDLLTVDAQKIYGPKGVGFLFKKHNVRLAPIFFGGGQEGGLRPGTEPVGLIVGCAEAFVIAEKEHKKMDERIRKMRDYFFTLLKETILGVEVNGDLDERVANNINVFIPRIDAEFVVIKLDQMGISASSASACLSKDDKGSYVIRELGKGNNYEKSSLRFTLGRNTSMRDIRKAVTSLQRATAHF